MSIHVTTAAQALGWWGIAAGDWLSAVTNMLAIIIGVFIAAKIAPKVAERAARRDQRERLLRILLSTWLVPANSEYQGAISLIRIDFKGCDSVLLSLDEYLACVNFPAPTDDAEAKQHFERTVQLQADLIASIAEELDFDVTSEALRTGAYISKGFVDRELMTDCRDAGMAPYRGRSGAQQ